MTSYSGAKRASSESLLQVEQINLQKVIQIVKQKQISYVKVVVSNNILVLAQPECSLIIVSLTDGNVENAQNVDIPHKMNDSVMNIFIDFSGIHIIVTLNSGDTVYFNQSTLKPKKLSKVQGLVESASFGREILNDIENKRFLVGTTAGSIYEFQIDKAGIERNCCLIYQLDQPLVITSIHYDYLGISNNVEKVNFVPNESKRVFIIFATSSPTRLYHACTFNFTNFKLLFENRPLSFIELPGDVSRAVLQIYGVRTERSNIQPFALMTDNGIYHGSITFPKVATDELFTETQLLPYSFQQSSTNNSSIVSYNSATPLSIAPTVFHFLILTADKRFQVVNRLNSGVVYDYDIKKINEYSGAVANTETPIEFMFDQLTQQIYLYTDASIYQINLRDEDRNNWRIYLKRAITTGDDVMFDYAMKCCKRNQDKITVTRAKVEYNFIKMDTKSACKELGSVLDVLTFDETVLKVLGVYPLHVDLDIRACLDEQQEQQKQIDSQNNNNNTNNGDLSINQSSIIIDEISSSLPVLQQTINNFIYYTGTNVNSNNAETSNNEYFRIFLQEVLIHLPYTAKIQRTMIATWLCEGFLHDVTFNSLHQSIQQHDDYAQSLFQEINNSNNNNASDSVIDKATSRQAHASTVPLTTATTINTISTTETWNDTSSVESEFKEFLTKNRSSLDRNLTFAQLIERGSAMATTNEGILLHYAQAVGDYDKVVGQLIGENKYIETIRLLQEASFENVEHLICKWASLLLERAAKATMDMLISKPKLKLNNLLPSLLQYCDVYDRTNDTTPSRAENNNNNNVSVLDKTNFAMVYLQHYFCRISGGDVNNKSKSNDNDNNNNISLIYSKDDAAVYHSLIWMLCKYDDSSDGTALLSALKLDCDPMNDLLPLFSSNHHNSSSSGSSHNGIGDDANTGGDDGDEYEMKLNPYVDYNFILRQCQMFDRKRGIVCSFLLLGLYSEAVEVALTFDTSLAKGIAKRHMSDSIRKNLWLQIAIHAMHSYSNSSSDDGNDDNNISQKGLAILRESEGSLKIQDLLPHLPDFTAIDLFKEEVCQTLEECNSHIDGLKIEMEELCVANKQINKELNKVSKKGYSLSAYQQCEYCEESLFSRPFYLFPCKHGFHCRCIYQQALSQHHHLDASQCVTVMKLDEQIRNITSTVTHIADLDKRSQTQLEYLQTELDGYIGADCPFCGFLMIESLNKSLLCNETEEEIKSWELI